MTWEYSEDNLIEQTAIDLSFIQLSWESKKENKDQEEYSKRGTQFYEWATCLFEHSFTHIKKLLYMSDIILYQTLDKQTEIEVQFDGETVWLSQKQMAELFDKNIMTINEHIKNTYQESELDESPTIRKSLIVQKEGKRSVKREIAHYNLDVIISVGYRVKSKRGTQFRQWATQRLKDYLVQGYAINEKRLAEKQQQVEYLKTGIRI